MPSEACCLHCGKSFPTFRKAELHEKICQKSKQKEFSFNARSARPVLVRCGKNFIDPSDVSKIVEVRDGLFVVEFKSNPTPDFKCWLRESEVENLISYFEVRE
jgi:hypothetical protein